MPYCFTVTYTVAEESREAVADALRAITTPSRAEPGVMDYRAHVSPEDPCTFMVYEVYDEEASFAKHRESEHFAKHFHGVVAPAALTRTFVAFSALEPD
ncbi:putative quinol monooxygenase [Pseudonocardia sp. Cha107L01]|uniref:putative quinol monooxygenase n=1 Tax=Pseudonocardia sp. Cha107L01 TaxID=3457576 RepID=UPI00403E4ED4